ncbi:hypothetical protein J437_LFUL012025, partial [Ladona fulva]
MVKHTRSSSTHVMDSEKILFLSGVSLAVAVGLYVLWGPTTIKKKKKSGIVGLANLGHTCFLNTLLQALASCPTFVSWLSWHSDLDDELSGDYLPEKRAYSGLAAAIYKVIQVVNGNEVNELPNDESAYAPYCVLHALGRRGWAISPGEQDAHELFHALLSTMGEEIENHCVNKSVSMQTNTIRNGLTIESHKPSLTDALIQPTKNDCLHDAHDVHSSQSTPSPQNDYGCVLNLQSHPLLENLEGKNGGGDELMSRKESEMTVLNDIDQEISVNSVHAKGETGVKIVLSESSEEKDSVVIENLEGNNGGKLIDSIGKTLDSLSVYALSYPGSPNPSHSPVSVQSPTQSASPSGSPKKKAQLRSRRVQFALSWRQRVLRYTDGRYTSQQLDSSSWDATGGLVSSLSGSPFRGFLTSQLKCMSCGFKSPVRYDKFDSLSLSLPPRGNDAGLLLGSGNGRKGVTLEFLLHRFVSRETVEGVACEGCTQKRREQMRGMDSSDENISSPLPKCLCFHIQRTTWYDNGLTSKRHDFVAFPEYLCMEMYTYLQASLRESKVYGLKAMKDENSSNGRLSKSQLSLEFGKTEVKAPLSPPGVLKPFKMDVVAPSTSEGKLWHRPSIHRRNTFRLTAVVVHVGDSNSGHFVTYRRGPPHSPNARLTNQRASTLERNGDLNYSMLYRSSCRDDS